MKAVRARDGAHLVVVILVASARLEEDVERPTTSRLALEGSLLTRVGENEVEPLLVEELEGREDLAESDASLLEDALNALKVGHAKNGDVDGLEEKLA